MKQCMKLPFVATDDAIFNFLKAWLPEWCALDIVELERLAAPKKKDDAKLHVAQLDDKR